MLFWYDDCFFARPGALERSQDFLLNEVVFSSKRDHSRENKPEDIELPLFDFNAIALATKNFCDENKLGQGGFGCVYKVSAPFRIDECGQINVNGGSILRTPFVSFVLQCRIEEGPVVAVKRLSKNSGQGTEEFKNEVRLIARLQHRNLVRLIGCCVELDEKILIYEYMEHKSLDSVLFSKFLELPFFLILSKWIGNVRVSVSGSSPAKSLQVKPRAPC